MNRIELVFDKDVAGLAGNDYGYQTYQNQVKSKIKWDDKNVIVFPSYIERVAISFIQGFCREILQKVDKNDVEKIISIESSSESLTEKILMNMKF